MFAQLALHAFCLASLLRPAPALPALTVWVDPALPRHNCSATLHSLQQLLTATSLQFHNITGENIVRVEVELPPGWSGCTAGLSPASRPAPASPDILLTGQPGPTAVTSRQFGGCGVAGRGVSLPASLLHRNTTTSQLLSSLLQHRYGVFSTHGSTEDPTRFPETFSLAGQQVDNCAEYDWTEKAGYDSTAPTPHNLLCEGRSPLAVVRETSPASAPQLYTAPQLEFSITESTRYLLVLDRSEQSKHVWEHLYNALYRFISALPAGDEVGVITFGRQARTRLAPTVVSATNRAGLHGRVPGRAGAAAAGCTRCAVRQAELLAASQQRPGLRSKIIIVTASQTDDQTELGRSLESLSKKSQVFLILVGSQAVTAGPRISNNLQIFTVNKEEQKSVSELHDILSLTLTDGEQERSNQSVRFFSDHFSVTSNERLSGKFIVEESLRRDLVVTATTEMKEDIERMELTSPSGVPHQFPTVDKGQVYFQLGGLAEAGVWSYSVQLSPRTAKPVLKVRLSGRAAPTRPAPTPRLEAWWHTPQSGPTTLYARLTEGGRPVGGAEVEAEVSRPDGEVVQVLLRDSGTGYPDLTSGDGIYSAYFTQLSQLAGLYAVRVTARNHQGRAVVGSLAGGHSCGPEPLPSPVPALHFTRFARPSAFFLAAGLRYAVVEGVARPEDRFPPARITDLHLVECQAELVCLVWTAPGGDLDSGRAEEYILTWSQERELAGRGEGRRIGGQGSLPVPRTVGTTQNCSLAPPATNTQLFFSIAAVDSAGNSGPPSNLLPVFVVKEEVAAGRPEQRPAPSSALTLPPLTSSVWVYILSTCLALVSILIILFVLLLVRRRRRRKLEENCPIPYFIELGPPGQPDKTELQLVAPGTATKLDCSTDTLSYPASPAVAVQHPVVELYRAHQAVTAELQTRQLQWESRQDSCYHTGRESSSGSEGGSEESSSSNITPSLSSAHTDHSRQSRRRRESFV